MQNGIKVTPSCTVFDGEAATRLFSMRAQMGALKLEMVGMKRRGASVYSIVKKQYGLTGNKQSVYDQLSAMFAEAKAKVPVTVESPTS